MMRTLLVRGMLAGLLAGVLATVFAYFFGEPSVNVAIGLEESAPAAHEGHEGHAGHAEGHAHGHGEEAVVSRDLQSTVGLFTGVAAYGLAVGGLFAIAFALVQGRVGTLRPRLTSALLAAGAFVVVVLVPFLKYPANPPAVGSSGTIGDRTALYFAFLALSVLCAIVAVIAGRMLADRLGAWPGGLLACGGYLVAVAVSAALLPVVDEVGDFPATTLWTFRTASLGTQVVLWATLGLAFGTLAERVLRERPPATAPEPAGQR
ncbi:putative cobalt transporter subunit CbtA [Prauserella shujinwangii]|uniref:Putative cobalt transporter subunit CbtA n=1 Tax=Prauserella shujinwangii TaxID=1453103 RepID=A0A2T0LW46_9PSEU|nr:CbtA family protein [Prauserella shujinwangii]PRX48243.1 putative cobalt transporter subunit CbtA [Prauserella shujinwangii]